MELRRMLAALKRAWFIPLVAAAVFAAGAWGVTASLDPQYTAETQFFVSTLSDDASSAEALQGSQFSQQRVASYARLLTGRELAERVIESIGLDIAPSELTSRITATAVTDTVLLDVAVTDESPARARRIADRLGVEFTAFVTELETPEGSVQSPVKVTVTSQPELPDEPSSPDLATNVLLAAIFGLLAGGAVVVIRAEVDRTVRDSEEAINASGAPVIGAIVRSEDLAARHVIDRRARTRVVEDYRQLRTNLQFLNVDNPPRVIMVSSAMPAEGKTTAAINLALALAEAGRQVTLVDGDLRRPRVSGYLGLVGDAGLTNVLAGAADVVDVLQPYGDSGMSVLGSGPTPPNPSELLASKHMVALLETLRAQSEFVLIDAPPILPVADATSLAVIVDGVLISVRYGHTRREQLHQAATTLEQVGARTLGVILNIVPPKADAASAYGYGYAYEESPKHAR
ncbi:polysaccharide biosynthesis tyrosine autokinase [Blastococcus sp. SYSU DS0552]